MNLDSRARLLLSLMMMFVVTAIFDYSAKAESTITIPVPDKAALDRKVTLSLRIPPNTEPLTKGDDKLKVKSARSLIIWNNNPNPSIPANDEVYTIIRNFFKKGWITGYNNQVLAAQKPLSKYYVVSLIESIADYLVVFAQTSNLTRKVRKCNLDTSDIEDLRRMLQRFTPELKLYGRNPKLIDKDLLMLQERFKTARQGILKVIKVEGVEDGGTVIHLSVD